MRRIAASAGLGVILVCTCMSAASAGPRVDTQTLQLEFDNSGQVLAFTACFPSCADPSARRLRVAPERPPVAIGSRHMAAWSMQQSNGPESTELKFELADTGATRTWHVPASGWRVRLETSNAETLELASDAGFIENDAHGFARLLGRTRYVLVGNSDITTVELDETPQEMQANDSWAGFRNRHWAILAQADAQVPLVFKGDSHSGAAMSLVGTNSLTQYSLYLGPIEPDALSSAATSLTRLMYASLWQPLRWICFGLYRLLQAIHHVVPHWATSIMLLSLSVSILMWPLSRIADRLQQDVQATESRLGPRIGAIKAEFRGEAQAERLLALYREEGVHPLYSMKSLAGIAVVIPVFIGAFDMLADNIWLAGEHFLWIRDLARPDSVAELPFTMPFLGNHLNLLPFLMTGLSVYASWLHQTPVGNGQRNPQLQRLLLLATAFLLLFYTFPAGMVLYWTTNNAIAVAKNLARRHRLSRVPGE